MDATDSTLNWRTSSYTAQGADCVEVAQRDDRLAIRDSKNPTGPVLALTAAEWSALLNAIKTGTHDLP